MTRGTLIVFVANDHVTETGVFMSFAAFKEWEALVCRPFRGRIDKLVYAWGGETQTYNAAEAEEVIFGSMRGGK